MEAARPRLIVESKDKKNQETPDLVIERQKIKTDLIPPALIVARYFADEQVELERLQAAANTAASELDAFVEEHGGEEGLLVDVVTDDGKVTKTGLRARIKELQRDGTLDNEEEWIALHDCLALLDTKSAAERAVKKAQDALDRRTLARYGKLSEGEIKALVIDDKWLAAFQAAIDEEVGRVAQRLTGCINELEERYAEPLPAIEAEVAALREKVAAHLARMGLTLE